MSAKIIDGVAIAAEIRTGLKQEVEALALEGFHPGLAVVLVGDNPASQVYVRNKKKACAEIGITSFSHELPNDCTEDRLLGLIRELNEDDRVHGILVQLPLPKHLDEQKVVNAMSPAKDADGLHPANVGKMLNGEMGLRPCTPRGCQELLVRSGYDPKGKHVVIVGRSNLVGKPVAAILMQKAPGADATVTVCHSRTRDLAGICRQADILIAAIGVPEFVKPDMVREGAVVIDVGINRIEDASTKSGTRLVGDVAFAGVKEKVEAITPVPGGVGPMTITMLMRNTIDAALALRAK